MRAPASPNAFENVRTTTTPSSISPTAVSPPEYSKYASSTTSGRASGSGGRSPNGFPGRQQYVSTGFVSPMPAPASSAATRNSGYVGSCGIATVSPGRANARPQSRSRSSAPAPSTTFSGSTPAYRAIASSIPG